MKKKIIAFVLAQMLAISCSVTPVFAEQEGAGTNSIRSDVSSQEEEQSDSADKSEAEAMESFGTGQEEMPGALSREEEQSDSPDETEADLIESCLAGQEEILLGLPAATDVRECGDADAFAQALADMNMDYPCDFDGEIVIDTEKDIVTDECGEEMVGADQFVTAALFSDAPEEAAEILRENGYGDVQVEDGMICVSDRYDTGRIFVTSSEPVDTSGALSVIRFGETYLIQYASSGEAAIAAEMLKDDPGVRSVSPDYVMRQSVITSDEVGSGSEASQADTLSGEILQADTVPGEVSPADMLPNDASPANAVSDTEASPDNNIPAEPDMADSIQEDTISEEESAVGRFFTGASTYKSAAVSYMGINRFLANTGTVNTAATVAVIDSGYDTSCRYVDYSRIRLDRSNCLAGRVMRDVMGHGTFIMNQIYEATDSAVTLVPYKLSDNTKGSYSSSLMLSAIYRAVAGGADFINLSSGADVGCFEEFRQGEDVLQYALDHGCYVITAAGNEKQDVNYVWPAKSSRCITVTSISYVTGQRADYANFGDAVDFAAPGGTDDAMLYGYTTGNKYVGMGGTSMAVPNYTAVLANLKANGRAFATISDLRSTLRGYCEGELTAFASSYYVGNGCVNLANAIDRTITAGCIGQIGSYEYTGTAICPEPVVSYGGTRLQKNRDYVISYSNNVNPGQARVTVTGRGIYTGNVYKEFTIKPKNLSGASVKTKYTHYDYTGSARWPSVTVTLDGKVLTNGTDYSLTYANNKNPGLATITVTGMGFYRGTATGTFQIGRRVASVISGYAYVLVPKAAAGRSVALKNGGMANNTALWVNTRTSAEAQQFIIKKNSDGTYALISAKCSMAVDSYNGNTSAGASAVVRNYSTSAASEKWNLQRNDDGTFLIINKNSGKALSAENGAVYHADVRMHTKSGSVGQRFYLEQVSSGVVKHPYEGLFTIGTVANTRYVIDVPAASTASGTVLQVYAANGSAAQQFRFLYSGNGTYRIANRNSGKVLMPTKSTAAPGATVVQGTWSGAACQQWRIVEKSNGSFALKNCAGYYLEMSGNTAKNGVKLRLNEYVCVKRMLWVT